MRLAYADPPYPGQSEKRYADHPDFAGEVDHAELATMLRMYDGFVLHTASTTLHHVLECFERTDDLRIMAWVKPFAAFKRNVSRWVFEWLGAEAGDTLDDLFPGSGNVARAWESWRAQPGLLIARSRQAEKRAGRRELAKTDHPSLLEETA